MIQAVSNNYYAYNFGSRANNVGSNFGTGMIGVDGESIATSTSTLMPVIESSDESSTDGRTNEDPSSMMARGQWYSDFRRMSIEQDSQESSTTESDAMQALHSAVDKLRDVTITDEDGNLTDDAVSVLEELKTAVDGVSEISDLPEIATTLQNYTTDEFSSILSSAVDTESLITSLQDEALSMPQGGQGGPGGMKGPGGPPPAGGPGGAAGVESTDEEDEDEEELTAIEQMLERLAELFEEQEDEESDKTDTTYGTFDYESIQSTIASWMSQYSA